MKRPTIQKTIWDDILSEVRLRVGAEVFNTWFRPIQFVELNEENHTLILRTCGVTKDWISSYYYELLLETMSTVGLADYKIDWATDKEYDSSSVTEHNDAESLFFRPSRDNKLGGPTIGARVTDIYPIEENLNPKYTFDKFVVGSSNQFAHAAAKRVAESPFNSYNPLFLYGGVGLGKTHLTQAIGHKIKQDSPKTRVSYITSERFMNELINAIRFNKTEAFRDKYRSIDVLLMDDVQFFAGKERTQTEFFHTFNALYNAQKQIVVTSDCPPRGIPNLEERLHSRFQWGLIADLEPPDLETKVAILKRKADLDAIDLSDEIAIYIASRIKSNIRELEGSLVRLVAISSLKGVPITKALAQEALKNFIDGERPSGVTIESIARVVATNYGLTVEELKAKNNSRSVATPRQIAMYLCKKLTRHSYPEIGREFGGKHHTTVMHSVDKIENLVQRDHNFHREVEELIDRICN